VTEAEWLGANSAHSMLAHLGEAPDPRKLRLFACACLGRWEVFFPDPSCRAVLQLGERYAQRRASRQQLVQARNKAVELEQHVRAAWIAEPTRMPALHVLHAVVAVTAHNALTAAIETISALQQAAKVYGGGGGERGTQAELLREVFGNPFRGVAIDPAWLRWNGSTVARLSRDIAESGRFEDLPVLADALEEAGCQDEALLRHCRSGVWHAPGCWVLDVLLGEA
jgi:hypothetical protein